MVTSSRFFFQLKEGEQLYAKSWSGYCDLTPSANFLANSKSGVPVSHQIKSA